MVWRAGAQYTFWTVDGTGAYVTLAGVAEMVEDDEDFVVFDAATGADITRSLLKRIIIERAGHG